MKCVLLSVPESTVIEDPLFQTEHESVVYELGLLNAEWHSDPTGLPYGTMAAGGRKLIPSTIELESSDPVTLLQALFLIFGLDWQVLGCQEYVTTTDEEGNVSSVYLPVQPEAYAFIPPQYEQGEAGMVQKAYDPSMIPKRDGQSPWV